MHLEDCIKGGYCSHRTIKMLVGLSIVLGIVMVSEAIYAEEVRRNGLSYCTEIERRLTDHDRASRIIHEGVEGMFFPMPLARLVLCESEELRLRRREIQFVVQEINLLASQIRLLDRQLELAIESRDEALRLFDNAQDRLMEVQDRSEAWYRSPLLWASIGVVLGAGIFIGAVYGLGSIDPD